jgi:hypothetical protein
VAGHGLGALDIASVNDHPDTLGGQHSGDLRTNA